MKKALRVLAVILLVCGLLLVWLGGQMQESVRPNRVSFGVVTNGNYTETGSGMIGGNAKAESELGALKGIGWLAVVAGAGLFGGSFLIKDPEEIDY